MWWPITIGQYFNPSLFSVFYLVIFIYMYVIATFRIKSIYRFNVYKLRVQAIRTGTASISIWCIHTLLKINFLWLIARQSGLYAAGSVKPWTWYQLPMEFLLLTWRWRLFFSIFYISNINSRHISKTMSLDTPFLISKTPEICLKIDSQVTQLGLPVLRLGLPLTRSLTAIWLTGILIWLPGFQIELTGLQKKQTAFFWVSWIGKPVSQVGRKVVHSSIWKLYL